MVELINHYLHIDESIFSNCLNSADNVLYVYYPNESKLLITPVSNDFFKNIHKCSSTFLKQKNAKGVRVFQIANILLDNEMSLDDRPLVFEADNLSSILTVKFN
jgi:hypothetical protein